MTRQAGEAIWTVYEIISKDRIVCIRIIAHLIGKYWSLIIFKFSSSPMHFENQIRHERQLCPSRDEVKCKENGRNKEVLRHTWYQIWVRDAERVWS